VQGTVGITPQKLVERDEALTPEPKAVLDAGLAEGLEDIRQGRVYGPFDSVDAMRRALHGTKPKSRPRLANAAPLHRTLSPELLTHATHIPRAVDRRAAL
jgi:hypothetical protein